MHVYLMTPFARYFMNFRYMMTPTQLIFLCEKAKEATVAGNNFIEIGCAYGDTTIFICKYLEESGHKVNYKVIDTFEGFEQSDIEYEINERNISAEIKGVFVVNDIKWFRKKMKINQLNVTIIKSNACEYEFSNEDPIAFCLLDIDLYQPTIQLLPILYDRLAEGGIIVVDDCDEGHALWNGAYQAYIEFVEDRNLVPDIQCRKLGVIRK